MKYCIERICPTGDVSEEFGDYSDEKEANRNAELLNMVQYKRTADMEELYLMLNNDSVAYDLWHDAAEKYALKMVNGEAVMMENVAHVMIARIIQSCDRLINWRRKMITDALDITKEQKEIVAWQWFYNSMMDLYTYYKGRQK